MGLRVCGVAGLRGCEVVGLWGWSRGDCRVTEDCMVQKMSNWAIIELRSVYTY